MQENKENTFYQIDDLMNKYGVVKGQKNYVLDQSKKTDSNLTVKSTELKIRDLNILKESITNTTNNSQTSLLKDIKFV